MATAEPTVRGPLNRHSAALAHEWRGLGRIATAVAVFTAPTVLIDMYHVNHLRLWLSILITVVSVIVFRGAVEVLSRRLIPSPSLYGVTDAAMRKDDLIARRRYWYWRAKFRRLPIYALIVLGFFAIMQALLAFAGVSAPFFDPWPGLQQIFPPDQLPQLALVLFQLPLLFLINFGIFFGPFLFFAIRQIRAYEPGDASWGVRMEDVRGQAEAKEEITRVITLWQSGEEFEKAGGKRERGLLFLGAPGTGKTMISKAIATNFNCPFVTIPGSGFAGMFIGMDALTVQFLARKARKLAAKWGGQCIVFIDEIDAVGMRRASLGGSAAAKASDFDAAELMGPLISAGDVTVESRAWRDWLFAQRAERTTTGFATFMQHVNRRVEHFYPGFGMGGGGQALNQLLVVMDGIDEPPVFKKFFVNRFNTFLDAMFVVPQAIGGIPLRLSRAKPRSEQIYFIGACNVPITALDPALIRPGRMGRHIWFRTPTKDDRMDILDLYINKVDHEPDLDSDRRRDELARITSGYSPSMIEQCCSMALTIAHTEGRRAFGWSDIVEAMTTVESGTAQNIDYIPEESRSVAIHEAGHAVAGHIYMEKEVLATRLSIRKRGGSLGHYMSMEREERFTEFRSTMMGTLIMKLGAMAAEHVFYGENQGGVSHDVETATGLAAAMVGVYAMGPEPIHIGSADLDDETRVRCTKRLDRIGSTIMNRASGAGQFSETPIGKVLGDHHKQAAAAQILGQAYLTAYALMAANRDAIEEIATELVERKEIYGDDVVDLLDRVGLRRPELDLHDDSTWPRV
jgi:ATP-dependent Zn protease